MSDPPNLYSAGEQALGYMYQNRLALQRMLVIPESTSVLIERDDDLDFSDPEEGQILASLKHKKIGDVLTDLSPDFWKSVRIWLDRYTRDGGMVSSLTFFLFTTGKVQTDSFLSDFLPSAENEESSLAENADRVLEQTKSKTLLKIKEKFDLLDLEQKEDFLSRIVIFDHALRIDEIPDAIMDRMRSVRTDQRERVFERLEGWWTELVVQLLTGKRTDEVYGRDVSDKLAAIADQFKTDNLPIDFRGKEPSEGIDPENDPRMFVAQLRILGIKPGRIQNAILDYYRAFEQRSSWAREHLLIDGEVEEYETLLESEWERHREIAFEDLDESSTEVTMIAAGKQLFKWAEINTDSSLRIRPSVSEPYVTIGSFHILANGHPVTKGRSAPKIHWHPKFLERLDGILVGGNSR